MGREHNQLPHQKPTLLSRSYIARQYIQTEYSVSVKASSLCNRVQISKTEASTSWSANIEQSRAPIVRVHQQIPSRLPACSLFPYLQPLEAELQHHHDFFSPSSSSITSHPLPSSASFTFNDLIRQRYHSIHFLSFLASLLSLVVVGTTNLYGPINHLSTYIHSLSTLFTWFHRPDPLPEH